MSKKKIYLLSLLTIAGTLIVGQLQRFQIGTGIAIYGHEILLAILTLIFAPDIWEQWSRIKYSKRSMQLSLILFLSMVLIHQVIAVLVHQDFISLMYMIRILLYMQVLQLLWIGLEKNWIKTGEILAGMILISYAVAVVGLAQYVFVPDTRFLFWAGWDDHYFRLISTLFDPGYTGLLIGIGLILFVRECESPLLKHFGVLTKVLFVLALLLTYSRASWLAVGAGLLFLFWRTRKKSLLLILLAIILSLPFLPRPGGEGVKIERTASISSRLESSNLYLSQLTPVDMVFGKGLYTSTRSFTQPGLPNHTKIPDNFFLYIFGSFGVVGIGLLVWYLKTLTSTVDFSDSFEAIIVTVAIHSVFNNSFLYPWVMMFLFALITIELYTQRKQLRKK